MKQKDFGLILSLDRVIKIAEGILEKAYASRKKLRRINKSVDNFIEYQEALIYHLRRLKEHETSVNQCN